MTHEMKLQDDPFRLFAEGKKRVEVRLLDEKRRTIRPGDAILFRRASGTETLTRYVVRLHFYPTFAALFAALPHEAFGCREGKRLTVEDMHAYYSPEEEQKWGVVGIETCEDEDVQAHMTEREAWEYVSRKVFEKYDAAFRALAKL